MSEAENRMSCEQAQMLLAQALFDELDESAAQARALRSHLELCSTCRARMAEMRAAAGLVTRAMVSEPAPKLGAERRAAVLEEFGRAAPRVLVLRVPVWSLAVAAALVIAATIAWVLLGISGGGQERSAVALRSNDAAPTAVGAEAIATAPLSARREEADLASDAAAEHLSPTRAQAGRSVAGVADAASYELAQRYLRAGYLPPPGAVRTEDFVNAVQDDPRLSLTSAAAAFAEWLRGGAGDLAAIRERVERIASQLPNDPKSRELLEMVRAAATAKPAP